MQLIIIILGRGSAPPQTSPRTDNNYKKNESVTNDSLSLLHNLQWMSASWSVKTYYILQSNLHGRPMYYWDRYKSHLGSE